MKSPARDGDSDGPRVRAAPASAGTVSTGTLPVCAPATDTVSLGAVPVCAPATDTVSLRTVPAGAASSGRVSLGAVPVWTAAADTVSTGAACPAGGPDGGAADGRAGFSVPTLRRLGDGTDSWPRLAFVPARRIPCAGC